MDDNYRERARLLGELAMVNADELKKPTPEEAEQAERKRLQELELKRLPSRQKLYNLFEMPQDERDAINAWKACLSSPDFTWGSNELDQVAAHYNFHPEHLFALNNAFLSKDRKEIERLRQIRKEWLVRQGKAQTSTGKT